MKNTNITAGTIARTVILFLALLNQTLTIMGRPVLPIDDETITQFISLGATVVASAMAWWKNNSFTDAARRGDMVMQELKNMSNLDEGRK